MVTASLFLAMFPVLFVSYLTFLVPGIGASGAAEHPWAVPLIRWLITLIVIFTAMALNLRGAREVGVSAKINTGLVIGAFALMLIVWLKRFAAPGAALHIISRDLAADHKNGVLLLGVSYAVFNFSSWDAVSTYAGEVDRPQRNYPRAIAIALIVMVLSYLLPVLAGITVTTKPQDWSADAGWPVIAQLMGGNWLGGVMAAAGMISMWSLYVSGLLYLSRVPYAMACDGWLPKIFAQVPRDMKAPRTSILSFSALAALFTALSFGSLAIISSLLYSGALTLQFLSLIALRIRRPRATRAFRVPGGWLGMTCVCVTPFAFDALVLYATLRDWRAFPGQLLVVGLVASSGVILYWLRRAVAAERRMPLDIMKGELCGTDVSCPGDGPARRAPS